jgi:mono/diheme cytochrome c family protein
MRFHLLLLLLVGVLAGCGGGDGGNGGGDTGGGGGGAADGEAVFAEAGCGSCHTFEAAGSSGTTGPNLDDASPSFEAAKQQIENGGGGMPAFKDQLSQEEIDAVARFVSGGGSAAGDGDGGGRSAVGPFSP